MPSSSAPCRFSSAVPPWRSTEEPNRSSVHAPATSRGTAVRYWIRAIRSAGLPSATPAKAHRVVQEGPHGSWSVIGHREQRSAAERSLSSPVHLALQHFLGSSGFRARAFPSAIHDLSPPRETSAFRHPGPTSRRKGAFLRFSFGGCDRSAGSNGFGQSPSCEESGA